jgi:hypothetical protein
MVSRAGGHHTFGFIVIAEFRHAIVGASNFVGTRALQVFTFEMHGVAQHFAEVPRKFHGSLLRHTF